MWNQKPAILFAEDDQDDVFIVKRTLKKVGINNPVQWVEDGEQALTYLRGIGPYKNRLSFPFPGVIITDIKMPKVSGFEVLKWLQRHPECGVIPTVVLSASSEEKDVVQAYQCGANCYLQKPRTPEEMTNLMKLMFDFWNACKIPGLSNSECADPNPPDKK
jgi:CheY-like chemotaxis protein